MKFLGYIFLVLFVKVSFAQNDTTKEVFTLVETMPEFPGGSMEMMKFIQRNITYPIEAKEKNLQGKCFLKYVVDKDGSITDVVVLKGVPSCLACDNEAIRVVKMMPKWKPGTQNGLPVAVFFNLPISFKTLDASEVSSYKQKISDVEANNILLADKNYSLGNQEYQKGNIEKAIFYFKETLKYKDSDIDALYNLGVIYQKQGDSKNSCEMFNKIKNFGRSDADALIKKYCSN